MSLGGIGVRGFGHVRRSHAWGERSNDGDIDLDSRRRGFEELFDTLLIGL